MNAHENRTYYTCMSGEFYVLAQLFSRGYMASLTYGNAKSVDILVSSEAGKMFKVEVKTARKEQIYGSDKSQFGANYEWQMWQTHEEKIDENLYYCFVMLRGTQQIPKFFIVRSKDVADYVKREHTFWLGIPRTGKVKNVDKRIFRIGLMPKSHGLKPIGDYEDAWHTLPP